MELQQTKPRWIKLPAAQASSVPGVRGQSHDSSIRIGLNRQSLGGPRIGGPPVAQASIDEASMDESAPAKATISNATMAQAAADQTATVQGYAAPKLSQRPKPQKPKTRRDSRCGPSLDRPSPDGCIPPLRQCGSSSPRSKRSDPTMSERQPNQSSCDIPAIGIVSARAAEQ